MAEVLPALPGQAAPDLSGNTIRNIVHLSTGGQQVRIRVSNVFGKTALRIGSAHLALRRTDASIDPSSDRPVHFSGQTSIAIPAGADVLSDPVALPVRPKSDLAVSFFFPDHPAGDASVHASAFQTSYVLSGDASGAAEPSPLKTLTSWYHPCRAAGGRDRDRKAARSWHSATRSRTVL